MIIVEVVTEPGAEAVWLLLSVFTGGEDSVGFPGLKPPKGPPGPSLPPTGGDSVGFPGLKPPNPPPGPSLPPTGTDVVVIVTVCEHKPTTGTKFWPRVEVMVTVHGIIPGMFGILAEGVISGPGGPFGGNTGGSGSLGGEGGFGDSDGGLEIVGWAIMGGVEGMGVFIGNIGVLEGVSLGGF